jgi:hypothetical protein
VVYVLGEMCVADFLEGLIEGGDCFSGCGGGHGVLGSNDRILIDR